MFWTGVKITIKKLINLIYSLNDSPLVVPAGAPFERSS
jgi:hypothetical protein